MKCIYCGCTENNACHTDDGPCAWVCDEPPICSADPCLAKARADMARSAPEGVVGGCMCEQVIYTSATEGYCVRCRRPVTAEAA